MPNYDSRVQFAFASQHIFTPAVCGTCIAMVLLHLACYLFPEWVVSNLALSGAALSHGKIWTLATYSLVNPQAIALIMNCSVVLFIGSAVEREWRVPAWIVLWIVTAIICGLLYLAASAILHINLTLQGSGACAFGLIGAYGVLFRHNQSFLLFGNLKAHHAALLLIAVGILICLPQPISLISVAGSGVAYGYVKLLWLINRRTSASSFHPNTKKPGAFVDVD